LQHHQCNVNFYAIPASLAASYPSQQVDYDARYIRIQPAEDNDDPQKASDFLAIDFYHRLAADRYGFLI
jgi:hypothetical protein